MKKEEIIETVNAFLIDEFEIEVELLIPDANLRDDLDIESLDFVDIAVEVEKKFGFKLASEEMVNVQTLDDLCNYILKKV
jgi:acyl carrier protein